jgi:signal transduction histidine kinase
VKKYDVARNLWEGPASQRVHGVCFDAAGNVYAATSAGLSFFDKKTGRFTHYSTAEGLCHPTIYCLTPDRQGQVWCGTGNGLSCFDPATKTFKNFFKSDGLINSEYNRNSAFTAPNGRIFMGGTEGLDYFVPAEIIQREFNYTPIIGEVSLPNRNLDPSANAFLKTDENNLTFSVTVSDLSRAQTMRFFYLLEGSKSAVWQTIATGNEIQFANLEPGKYVLRVKASNLSGKENTKEAQFAFTIAAPWYTTIWFTIICILSGIALIYGLVRNNEIRKRRKLEQENELFRLKAEQATAIAQERERITADLHDDVGATLSSLNIYGDLAHSIWETNPEKSKEMVGKIAGQSRELMLRMSDIIWSMKPNGNDSSGLTPRIRNFAQDLLSGKGIMVNIYIDETTVAGITNPMVRKNIILIIKEVLNNVAKYSSAAHVEIFLGKKENGVQLSIQDDGKGFDRETVTMGNGLENMAARCRQMEGNFELDTHPGRGTTITCLIPLAIISYKSNQ